MISGVFKTLLVKLKSYYGAVSIGTISIRIYSTIFLLEK